MKRWIAVALFLLVGPGAFTAGLFTLAQAQAPSIRSVILDKRPAVSASFTPSCTESTNFIARTSGLDTTHKTNYDNLICGMVTDGDFSGLDAAYIWATDTQANANLSLVSATYNGSTTGTVSFSADHGYTGDGSTFFFDTAFNPASAPTPKYVINSATMGVCILSSISSGGTNAVNMGANNVGAATLQAFFFGNTVWQVNGPTRSVASSNAQGSWVMTRTASNAVALYKNGNTTAVDSGTDASDFVPFRSLYFFAYNDGGGTPNSPTVAQMGYGFFGSSLTSAAQARVVGRFSTYMNAYGNSQC